MPINKCRKKKSVTLPATFQAKFWENADYRVSIVREIRRRYQQLTEDTATDSYQKDLLCQRAVFIGVQLESMEVEAADTGKFDPGVYTQMANSLLGLLKALGLEKQFKTTLDLKTYVNGRKDK